MNTRRLSMLVAGVGVIAILCCLLFVSVSDTDDLDRKSPDEDKIQMDCVRTKNFNIDRCENEEVVCYKFKQWEAGGISCQFKEKKR